MCVFMSRGRLSWLHKIELVISNISSPKGGCVGAGPGESEMVASCQAGDKSPVEWGFSGGESGRRMRP